VQSAKKQQKLLEMPKEL